MSYARSQRRKALKRDRLAWIARAREIRIHRLADKLRPIYGNKAIDWATAALMKKVRAGGEAYGG